MMNERPINDPALEKAREEIKAVFARYGLAGAVAIVGPEEWAFAYAMWAPWSAINMDASTPLGFRLKVSTAVDGREVAAKKVEGTVHTICSLADFAEQTALWMGDLKDMLRRNGIDWDHTSFGGAKLEHLVQSPPGAKTRT